MHSLLLYQKRLENNYQQDACQNALEAMLDCCERNASKDFPSCDGFKFALKKRLAEKQKQEK